MSTPSTTAPKKSKLTLWIIVAMILGVLVGYLVFNNTTETFRKGFSGNIKLLSTVFIRLVQMIIAPLVFTTLVVGISKLGDLKTVGRVGGKAMIWFITASLISLLIGLVLVNYFKPGQYIQLGLQDSEGLKDLMTKQTSFSLQNFVEHVIPKSFIEAMATNEILQLVIFSIFFGVAS
ncbi:MAG: cation:dicarboxylase symporter family transporter, partial [Chitinophagaceae bacterium]|nr:cation:dicarboxylase symporter family transporter [Chitinophagaceae bacterium]